MSNIVDFNSARTSDRAMILELAGAIRDIRALLSEMAVKIDADLDRLDRRTRTAAVSIANLGQRIEMLERERQPVGVFLND